MITLALDQLFCNSHARGPFWLPPPPSPALFRRYICCFRKVLVALFTCMCNKNANINQLIIKFVLRHSTTALTAQDIWLPTPVKMGVFNRDLKISTEYHDINIYLQVSSMRKIRNPSSGRRFPDIGFYSTNPSGFPVQLKLGFPNSTFVLFLVFFCNKQTNKQKKKTSTNGN